MAVPPLTPDEERELWTAIKSGDGADAAKRRLIEANLKLVIPIARTYEGHGPAFVDLAQEGNLGLIRAVELFDASEGHAFVPFTKRHINDAITRAIS